MRLTTQAHLDGGGRVHALREALGDGGAVGGPQCQGHRVAGGDGECLRLVDVDGARGSGIGVVEGAEALGAYGDARQRGQCFIVCGQQPFMNQCDECRRNAALKGGVRASGLCTGEEVWGSRHCTGDVRL